MSHALLPPHTEEGPTASTVSTDQRFDAEKTWGDRMRQLRDTPKQYADEKPAEPPPQEKTGRSDAGTGTQAETGPTGGPGKGPEAKADEARDPNASDRNSAKTLLDMYDFGMGTLGEALAQDPKTYPAERFHLPTSFRRSAEEQLSEAVASGKMGKVPWWLALSVILLVHGVMNYFTIRAARRERKERDEERQARPPEGQRHRSASSPAAGPPVTASHNGQPVDATLLDRNGEPIRTDGKKGNFGACRQCGKPLTKPNRTYCSQKCSGKASKGHKRTEKR